MIKIPEYGLDIIVLVKFCNEYAWYVSDKDFWVLDYNKWEEQFPETDDLPEDPERDGIPVVDTNNWLDFKARMENWKSEVHELNNMILDNLPISSWNEKGELFPSLFVDFDTKVLYSSFGETVTLEDNIPDGWRSEFMNFYYLIPQDLKYWIINGVDYLPLS